MSSLHGVYKAALEGFSYFERIAFTCICVLDTGADPVFLEKGFICKMGGGGFTLLILSHFY